MRSTTIVSLLFASWALISQSPAAYATPVPSQVDSAGAKRDCEYASCRIDNPPDTQSDVENLVDVLIDALETYQAQNTTA